MAGSFSGSLNFDWSCSLSFVWIFYYVRMVKSDWKGCTLTEIYYAGDDCTKDYKDWADRNNADEVIVLLSSFDVDSSGGNGSLNPNSTYSDWKWILVRTDGGKWQHVDHGY